MLILTRKVGESIIIGENEVKVKILSVSKMGKVSIGIEADREILVNREEIYERIIEAKK